MGYGVVQLAALASNGALLQEQIIEGNTLRQGNQVLLQENADLKRQLEELKGERGDELLRGEGSRGRQSTGEPLAKTARREPTRSEFGESHNGSQGGFLCYRCHRHCGSSAKTCEAEIPDLEMSSGSVLDLYTRGTSSTRWCLSSAAEAIVFLRMGR